ncbi:MAG: dTDP-4-dehydrorhamnose 3,5-epimerase [Anaerolineae bacterium]|nr:dTDP-4-dehydrorhamnose 3,5-epimerase [Anaerolineae bacterium]
MTFEELSLPGLLLITPRVFDDERGFFLERYNQRVFQEQGGLDLVFIQDNHSQSTRGILRGLHYQLPPFAQDKLVWVTRGEVFDVAVDLRLGSPTFGQWQGVVLSEQNKQMLLLPQGFAHGFLVLSEVADFQYKVTAPYSREFDRGIRWDDPAIGIAWPVSDPILSSKDMQQPDLAEAQARGEVFQAGRM